MSAGTFRAFEAEPETAFEGIDLFLKVTPTPGAKE